MATDCNCSERIKALEAVIAKCQRQAIERDGDRLICMWCSGKAPLDSELAAMEHDEFCPLFTGCRNGQ